MLKAKLHHARVTAVELEYEGSCAIDEDLLDMADIREYEQIHIYNKNNGERFITYVIRAERGSGIISINGAAAKKASVGDRIIICAYTTMDLSAADQFKPKLVYLGEDNQITRTSNAIPAQPKALNLIK
jgi:aspartate 1-decarboxylase